MPLKLMYITNDPSVAKIAESAGVDRIFVDMEYIGKSDRQGGMNTVQNHHTIDDIKRVRRVLTTAELLVRVNPIHEAGEQYCSSKEEIDATIEAGADIVMLPFFKTVEEVQLFLSYIDGRAKTMLLLETPGAVEVVDNILALDGIDFIHIGLNDLSLGYGKKFMFQLLADGTVESLCRRIGKKGIAYGFGGIAALGGGAIPAEMVIREHYRLGSDSAILSRSFCDTNRITDLKEIGTIFFQGISAIREYEAECEMHRNFFEENRRNLVRAVEEVIG